MRSFITHIKGCPKKDQAQRGKREKPEHFKFTKL